MKLVLDAHSVSKRFGKVEALQNIDIAIGEGETVALIGHNGAGKTTFFRLILGFLRQDSGTLKVAGHAPGSHISRNSLSYLPESVVFPKSLTGKEIVLFYARLKNSSRKSAFDALERVGLTQAMTRPCGGYSKGMRQRLGLAQALVSRPHLLLLDEPTSGLDPLSRQTFYELIAQVAREGTSVLLSSHSLSELESKAPRVVMLSNGLLAADGKLSVLQKQAGLPLRIRARAVQRSAAELAAMINGRVVDSDCIEIQCSPAEKMQVVRKLCELDPSLADLDFTAPTLEQLYQHYTRRELMQASSS